MENRISVQVSVRPTTLQQATETAAGWAVSRSRFIERCMEYVLERGLTRGQFFDEPAPPTPVPRR